MKSIINIRLDKNLKENLQNLADYFWLNLSAFINVILTKTVREKKLELKYDITENGLAPETEDKIIKYINSDEYKKEEKKTFNNVEDLINDLKS